VVVPVGVPRERGVVLCFEENPSNLNLIERTL
jgi:hypothetical protein